MWVVASLVSVRAVLMVDAEILQGLPENTVWYANKADIVCCTVLFL